MSTSTSDAPQPTELLSASARAVVCCDRRRRRRARRADHRRASTRGCSPSIPSSFGSSTWATRPPVSRAVPWPSSVVAYAVHLDRSSGAVLRHVLRRIAYKHCSLGIRPEQYTIVGRHLMAAVGEVLGEAVTPEVAAAWDEVYWLFAAQLIAEEARHLHRERGRSGGGRCARTGSSADRGDRRRGVSGARTGRRRTRSPRQLPGQYVSVFVNLPDGRRQGRQYTVSSTALGNRLQITVRRVRGVGGAPDGEVSTFLHD